MEFNSLLEVQEKTLVLTCTDLFHSFLQQPHHVLYRTVCNCVSSNHSNAMDKFAKIIEEKGCRDVLIIGHVSCYALEYNMVQSLVNHSEDPLPLRLGSIAGLIIKDEPSIGVEELVLKLACENIRVEVENFRQYFLNHHPELNIQISGAIVTETEALVPIESESFIF